MRHGKSQGNRSVEDLAFLFLNDKYSMRGIVNKFGYNKAMEVTRQMADTIVLCDPSHRKAKTWNSMSHRELMS